MWRIKLGAEVQLKYVACIVSARPYVCKRDALTMPAPVRTADQAGRASNFLNSFYISIWVKTTIHACCVLRKVNTSSLVNFSQKYQRLAD
jgi:hypothetical protein